MSTVSYRITGGDFDRVGLASVGLKERLKRIGVDPASVRRAAIAAYEAETNVAIHARAGDMWVRFSPTRIDVEVVDDGPGIPDINRAMQEGFSTASDEMRERGFGAGMGLPNIKKNSDDFRIESEVDVGTTLWITIHHKG